MSWVSDEIERGRLLADLGWIGLGGVMVLHWLGVIDNGAYEYCISLLAALGIYANKNPKQ